MTINNKHAFKVLETPPQKEPVDYNKIYIGICSNNLLLQLGNITQLTKDEAKKTIYWGVRALPLMFNAFLNKDLPTMDANTILNGLYDITLLIEHLISRLTPNQLITIFPIKKQYDGSKYEVKDYYTTMEELNRIGMDTAIGSNTVELMFDYQNDYICKFTITKMLIASAIRRLEGKMGIMEEFMESKGVPHYQLMTDSDGKKFIYDPQNHTTYKVSKPRPRYLRVV